MAVDLDVRIADGSPANKVSRKSLVAASHEISPEDAIKAFSAPHAIGVQILRPFAVYSRNSYSSPITVPIGPAYLAGILEAAGYRASVIDAIGEGIGNIRPSNCGRFSYQGLSVEEIIERIDDGTSILGVSIMFSQDWTHHKKLINAIKKRHPKLTIVVGGEHPSALPEFVLHDCPAIDFLVAGEGEIPFLEVCHAIAHGDLMPDIPGVYSRDASGQPVFGGPSRRMSDISKLPWPAWHLVQVEKLFTGQFSMGISYGRNMLILATRGCPYQCTFCSNPLMWTTRYVMRPVEDVVREIQHLIAEYQVDSFEFADLTAIVKKGWILEFCDALRNAGLNISWQLPSGTRSEALDEETLSAIHDAGCRYLVYAPESGSARMLKLIKKKLDLKKLTQSARTAVLIGHTVKINLIIGFPDERRIDTLKTMLFNIKMAVVGVHDSNISLFSPYPGSELFNSLRKDGVISELNDDYFDSLVSQFDMTAGKSYCKHVPAFELALYRFLGMAGFYTLTYTIRPLRLIRLIRAMSKAENTANNLFEQRLKDYFGRLKLVKKKAAH